MNRSIAAAAFALNYVKAANTCTGLALSGGGSNGAWDMGVLYGLLHNGKPEDFRYDVVTGISAGSINAIQLMGYEIGDELKATEIGSDLWKNLKTSDVWQDWYVTPLDGLLLKAGMMDNSPLLKFLESLLAPLSGFKRRITVGTVNINDGTFHRFDQSNTAFADMAKAAFSSASIPTVFPPYNWKGKGVFVDGSTATNINVEDLITQCKDLGFDESQIIVDILVCESSETIDEWDKTGKSATNYLRARSIHGHYHGTNTIADAFRAHPKVNFRYLLYQEDGFTSTGMINFNGDHTWKLQEKGRLQAQEALDAGEGTHFENLMKWHES